MTRNYVQVGAGGTGSFLFPALIRYLETYAKNSGEEHTITLIDGKEVTASKLERQLFFGRYAGNNKATALAEQYEANPAKVIAIPQYLGPTNIAGITNGDMILIAADNYSVRARIEEYCQELKDITVINGGTITQDGAVIIHKEATVNTLTDEGLPRDFLLVFSQIAPTGES